MKSHTPFGHNGEALRVVPARLRIISILLFLASVAIYVYIFFAGREFVHLFPGFGADLPQLTAFVLKSYRYFGAFALIGLYGCVKLVGGEKRSSPEISRVFTISVAGFFAALLLAALFVSAMYLPVFQMGALAD